MVVFVRSSVSGDQRYGPDQQLRWPFKNFKRPKSYTIEEYGSADQFFRASNDQRLIRDLFIAPATNYKEADYR